MKLASHASFVFKGTVQKLRATTMPGVLVTDQTIVVRVDEIMQAPKILASCAGKDITVQLGRGERMRKAEQAVFYANGWLFGESFAVQSIGHTKAGRTTPARAASPVIAKEDRDLKEHLARADLVVTGKVVSVGLPQESAQRAGKRSAAAADSTSRASEHSAAWREAVINVQDVDGGGKRSKQVVVRFPASSDVAWANAPKFKPGQQGVFILHRAGAKARTRGRKRGVTASAERGTEVYTALHAQDFQPMKSSERVKALVRGSVRKKPSASKRKR